MSGEALIRAYRPGDEQAINHAFNEVFGQRRTLAEWEWKYRPTSWSDHRWIEVAEVDGEIVAHCAALPVRLRVGERTVLGGQVVDVFSRRRQSLARRGPFALLMERFFAENCSDGPLAFVVGFPGDRHMRVGRNLLGYVTPRPVVVWSHVASPGRTRGGLSLLRIRDSASAVALDALGSRSAARLPASIVHDSAWAAVRWNDRPEVEYRQIAVTGWRGLEAWGVVRLGGPVARWADLLWDGRRDGSLLALARSVLGQAQDSGAERVEVWLGSDPSAERALRSAGWSAAPHPQQLEMSAISFRPDLDLEGLLPSLYVTMGDSDLV